MPQTSFERCLGRLILDPSFRIDFFSRPGATLARDGIYLREEQMRLLENLPITPLLELAASLAVPPTAHRTVPEEPAQACPVLSGTPESASQADSPGRVA